MTQTLLTHVRVKTRRWRTTLLSVAIGLVSAVLVLSLGKVESRLRKNHSSWVEENVAALDSNAYKVLFNSRGPEINAIRPGAASQGPVAGISSKGLGTSAPSREPETGIPEVVIVEITKSVIDNLQVGYPLPRSLHAKLLRKLKQAGASVVGMDIVFSNPSDPRNDQEFASALADCGNVILAAEFTVSENANDRVESTASDLPIPLFRNACLDFAPVDIPQDNLGQVTRFITRKNHIDLQDVGIKRPFPGFATRIAGAYRGLTVPRIVSDLAAGKFDGAPMRICPDDIDPGEDVPTHSMVRICFAGEPKLCCRYVTYDQALNIGKDVPAEWFRNKIVLIGSTEVKDHDGYVTPLMPDSVALRPGVEIQANIIHTLLDGHSYGSFPEPVRIGIVYFIGLLAALVTLRLRPLRALPAMALILGIFAAVVAEMFRNRIVLPPTQVIFSAIFGYGLETVYFYTIEARRANDIQRKFGRYVGPRVLQKVVDADYVPHTQGETYDITVLFSDVQGFTSLSEHMSAAEVVRVLNNYLSRMVDIIYKYDGTLDKIMGDGVMCYFNAPFPVPDHQRRAVECAIEMQAAMREWRDEQGVADLPSLKVRIGIHTGDAIVGDMGSPNQMGYTAIGDTVNIAARLEPLNKEFGSEILISEAVKDALPATITTIHVGDVAIRGREEGIRAYSVPTG